MNRKQIINCIAELFAKSLFVFCVFFAVIGLIKLFIPDDRENTSPVEKLRIDSLTKDNNKIIIEINNLDSIKNVEILEVKALDNDSTLRLFYELIRK